MLVHQSNIVNDAEDPEVSQVRSEEERRVDELQVSGKRNKRGQKRKR